MSLSCRPTLVCYSSDITVVHNYNYVVHVCRTTQMVGLCTCGLIGTRSPPYIGSVSGVPQAMQPLLRKITATFKYVVA